VNHTFRIRQGLVVPKAEDAIPLPFEICRPLIVRSLLLHVLPAIELDHQLGFRATEVRDEGADRMLASEPCASESAITKLEPYGSLGICIIAP